MNKFKINPGKYIPHYISRENFEIFTRKQRGKYVQIGRDGEQRCFAVCPACDNPIQLIGLYGSKDGRIYGKHYCRSVINLAKHNEQAYRLCPFASNNYTPPSKEDRKSEMTDFEINIYNTVREHFDQIVYIIKAETGLYIDATFARDLLRNYYAARGWMYEWSTMYNIPWMTLYLYSGFDIYGKLVRKGRSLHELLSNNNKYKLINVNDNYDKVVTNTWVESNFMACRHRRQVEDDEVRESITLELAEKTSESHNDHAWKTLWKKTLPINESRFLKLITSNDRAKYKDDTILMIAKQELPDL